MKDSRLKNRKSRKKRLIRIIGLLTVLLLIATGSAASYFVYKVANVTAGSQQELDRGEKSERRLEAVNPSKDNISVLLLGDDSRPGESRARTDAMIVATFNKEARSIILTSIPRDSRVELVGRGTMDKINHAHAYGGLDMAIATVENLLDIPIDYYALVKFEGLIDVVDALGGIEVDVPFDFEFVEKSTNSDFEFREGKQHLSGAEALAFARMRKHPQANGDIGRGQRQQQVIEGIIKKGATFSSISNFDSVMNAVGDSFLTSLTFPNILALHSYATSLNEIETMQLKGNNMRLNGIFYLEVDEQSLFDIQVRLKQHLEIDGFQNIETNSSNLIEESY
ncbi:LCP family glycopolymer transferase [Halalkalibacter akibai]|uniref:Cell envelope-associated transcriptional attenuator LytR-CpsA-Psr n=1 Tax=Halalkalibacter akibai (strain ATCC 43226 / DSM 21942 / CIP 109018 / JCM 9157 / 1139) TaxID=1236973 RepID=W4QWW7_HALA3|nr:LCP family protein [Halalkalibacter akibai]GAE35814.1 cell envelope-associated transcriptional attenuator LytR-CpsA-Psr [Halalkalibacter akibai JCM 9157]